MGHKLAFSWWQTLSFLATQCSQTITHSPNRCGVPPFQPCFDDLRPPAWGCTAPVLREKHHPVRPPRRGTSPKKWMGSRPWIHMFSHKFPWYPHFVAQNPCILHSSGFPTLQMIQGSRKWRDKESSSGQLPHVFMVPSGYLTLRHWKIHHAIKNGNPNLFRLGPSKNHGYVSHNQRVYYPLISHWLTIKSHEFPINIP